MHARFPAPRTALACLLLALMAGCSGERASLSQVAARVDDTEITLQQVGYLLARHPRVAEAPSQARELALESLVMQELAAQAAREQGIEKEPAFVQGMEAARRELLARLYEERLAATAPGVGTDEVDRYYDRHPALFSERRLYTLQELTVDADADADPGAVATVRQLVESAHSVADLHASLEGAGMGHRSVMTVQAPEAVPMRLLGRLAALKEGQSMLASETPVIHVWTLVRAQAAPIDRQLARGPIQKHLMAQRQRRIVAGRMEELRKSARIVYLGGFTAPGGAAGAEPGN